MSDKRIFVDSNILLNLFGKDPVRKDFVNSLKNQNYIISTQVVNENVSVCLKKLKLSETEAFSHGTFLMTNFSLVQISKSTIQKAFNLLGKYKYSYWDSLILSTALENDCVTVYSEDMQNGQIIENTVTILNPFIEVSKIIKEE